MNIDDAVYELVHKYPGGPEALAPRLGLSKWTIQHKADPRYEGAHFSPLELQTIQVLADRHTPLAAMADALHVLLVPMPPTDVDPGGQVAQALATTVREFSELMSRVAQDLADNKVSDNELADIEREGLEAMSAISALCAMCWRINQAAKPPNRKSQK